MKNIYLKSLAAALVIGGLTACSDDLNISSIDPQSTTSYDLTELLAKQYATLGLTGQRGATGMGDLGSEIDEGESGFYRTTFNCQELATDECIWAWQTDNDIPQFTNMSWDSSSKRVQWVYTRLGYDITQYNYFLSVTEGNESLTKERAEVRFLRALHYWYFLDLFHTWLAENIEDKCDHFFNFCVTAQALRDWCIKYLKLIDQKEKEIFHEEIN